MTTSQNNAVVKRTEAGQLVPVVPAYERGEDGVWRAELNSIGEIVELTLSTGAGYNLINAGRVDRSIAEIDRDFDRSWYNHHSIKSILQALQEAPKDLVEEVMRVKDDLDRDIPVPAQKRRQIRHKQEEGDELDPDSWRMGRTDGWSSVRRESTPKRVIRIGVNVAILGSGEQADVIHRGAAAVALADLLTEQGYSVELMAVSCSRNVANETDAIFIMSVPVKHSDMPMDVGAVTFALSDIAFFRAIMLRARGRLLPERFTISGDWGNTTTLPADDRAQYDYFIDSDVKSRQKAIDTVRAAFEQIVEGVGLE